MFVDEAFFPEWRSFLVRTLIHYVIFGCKNLHLSSPFLQQQCNEVKGGHLCQQIRNSYETTWSPVCRVL